MAKTRNDGTKLQDVFYAEAKGYCAKNPGYCHRFPDTKSARGVFLQKQPGDYLLVVPGFAVLVECKSTTTGECLVNLAKEDRGQLGKHSLWHRAGHPSRYVYADILADRLQVFDGSDVLREVRSEGKAKPLLSGGMKDMKEFIVKIVTSL